MLIIELKVFSYNSYFYFVISTDRRERSFASVEMTHDYYAFLL